MKIGVDIRVLMDENYSGVSQYAANLLTAIFLQDKENEYKLFYNSWNNLDEKLSIWNRQNAKVYGSHVPNKIFNYFYQKVCRRPKIDALLNGVDLFWSPHFNFTCLGPNTKKIITVHDLSFLRYPEFFSERKNIWHRLLEIKSVLNAADKIIAVSENTKNDIIELLGVSPEKIKVIYSGNNVVKKNIATEKVSGLLNKFSISGRIILYVGTIEPRKNIGGLIRAYNDLRARSGTEDVKLVLAGGNGWKNKNIYKEWEKSPYKSDIIFLGYISELEKEILYSKASVFAYPSFYEGFGFPPLEAMAYGVPVVCSNVSSLPEVVADAALMINPDKPEEISEALQLVLSNTSLSEKFVAKGYERAKLFTWDKAASQYLEVMKEIKS